MDHLEREAEALQAKHAQFEAERKEILEGIDKLKKSANWQYMEKWFDLRVEEIHSALETVGDEHNIRRLQGLIAMIREIRGLHFK